MYVIFWYSPVSAFELGSRDWGVITPCQQEGEGMRDCLGRYSLERVMWGRRKRKGQERANKMNKQIHPHQAVRLKVTGMWGCRVVPFSTWSTLIRSCKERDSQPEAALCWWEAFVFQRHDFPVSLMVWQCLAPWPPQSEAESYIRSAVGWRLDLLRAHRVLASAQIRCWQWRLSSYRNLAHLV